MFGNNAPDGAEILALLGMRPTTKHAPTLARPKIKFAKPRFVPTGSISAPDPSIRNSIQQTLAGVLSKAINERQAHRLAARAMAPLTDATPLGNVTGAEEGGKQFYRGLTKGDLRTAGLGALSFGLSVLPVPGGVKKAARKTGLFGSLMKDQSGAIRAWHGSPHDFDRFDISKIGTGEGAQAYGHGLYFAENKAVAEDYRKALTYQRNSPTYEDALAKSRWEEVEKLAAAKAKGVTPFNKPWDGGWDQRLASAQAEAEQFTRPGRLYEVNINAEPEDFLDWDAPLSGQPTKVRDALGYFSAERQKMLDQVPQIDGSMSYEDFNRSYGTQFDRAARLRLEPDYPGRTIYSSIGGMPLPRDSKYVGLGPATAPTVLQDLGLPGIRYLDQGSRPNLGQVQMYEQMLANLRARGAGPQSIAHTERQLEGARKRMSHNYVVFDDGLVEILNKF